MEQQHRVATPATASLVSVAPRLRQPLALVVSDDIGAGLRALTSRRSKAALPFAGKYRLIDFALSSCLNSGIERVGVITQYQPRSLHRHLAHGRPWDMDHAGQELTVLHPYQTRTGMDWYTGTTDAIAQNLDFVFRHQEDDVLVLLGDQVSTVDLSLLTTQHRKTQADLTVAVATVDETEALRHHRVAVDREGQVRAWVPPGDPRPGLLPVMGVLLFSADLLSKWLGEDAQRSRSTHDLIRDVLAGMVPTGARVMAFHHTRYWNALQTVHDYRRAHMRLVSGAPSFNLQDAAWPIRTRPEVRPPMQVLERAKVSHSVLSEGCVIEGTVEHSVLSPGVHVGPGAVVRYAIVMHDTVVEERAVVENAILDADVAVGARARVGQLRRQAPTLNEREPDPLTIVTQGVHIPTQDTLRAIGRGRDQPAHAYRVDTLDVQGMGSDRYAPRNN
jgi:glucose-1-phosphate adenylyltransferase